MGSFIEKIWVQIYQWKILWVPRILDMAKWLFVGVVCNYISPNCKRGDTDPMANSWSALSPPGREQEYEAKSSRFLFSVTQSKILNQAAHYINFPLKLYFVKILIVLSHFRLGSYLHDLYFLSFSISES